MKFISLLASLFLFGATVVAQEAENSKQYSDYQLDFNIGMSNWLKPSDFNNRVDLPALNLRLSTQKQFNESWAITLDLAGINVKSAEDGRIVGGDSREEESYKKGYILSGIKLIMGQKLKFYLNPQMGLGIIRSPEYKSTFFGTVYTREAQFLTSFAIGGQIGVELPASDRLYFKSSLSLYASSYNGETEIDVAYANGTKESMILTYKDWRHTIVSYTIGVGMKFGKKTTTK